MSEYSDALHEQIDSLRTQLELSERRRINDVAELREERDAAIALEADNRRLADEGTVAIVRQLEETKAALVKAMETIRYIRLHTLAEAPTCEQLMNEALHAIIVDIPVACDDMFSDPAATAAVATCTTCTHFRGEVCCNALSGRCADFITGGESCVSWEVQNAV